MDFIIGNYQVCNVPVNIEKLFSVLQLLKLDINYEIIPLDSGEDSKAFRILSTDATRLNIDIYYGLENSQAAEYFQLSAFADGASVPVLNTLDYGKPSDFEIEEYADFIKDFLESKIVKVGYFNKKEVLYYKELEYSIGEEKYCHLMDRKPWIFFKKLERKTLSVYNPWIY